MRLRKLALAVGLAGALGAELASALGLGEIKLNSTLNQPLEAEIKLLQARDLSKDEILVALASREDFQRAGIDRLFFLTELRFEVVLQGPSAPFVRVTSRKPVREPYLNFLLETQWPSGRILREYTLLMDLPVFSDENVRPVQSARTAPRAPVEDPRREVQTRSQQPATVSRREPEAERQTDAAQERRREERRTTTRQVARSDARGDNVYGPVSSSDTLWEIALKVRPSREFSVHQTMLAIQSLNPEAFINGNINLLRRGQVLRVPSADDIARVNGRQAVSEVAYQNEQWSSGSLGAQLEGGRRRAARADTSEEVSGRLKVAGSSPSYDSEAGRAAGEAGGDTEGLQSDLSSALEELDKSRRENAELTDRVRELEEQIGTMERLLEVSSQELRALQLASQQSERDLAVSESAATTTPAAAQDETVASAAPSAPSVAATPTPSPAVKPPATPDPSRVVRSQPKPPSLMDTLMDNLVYIGGGLLAVLAGVLLLLRRRQSEAEEETELVPAAVAEPEQPVFEEPSLETTEEPTEESVEEATIDEDILSELDADADALFEEQEAEAEAEPALPTESQTGDAVGEADIYIAYGKLEQAEEMLLKSLEANEGDLSARLKLMEVYTETKELDKFDQQYGRVVAANDAGATARAEDLRMQFEDAPAFDDALLGEEPSAIEEPSAVEEPSAIEEPSASEEQPSAGEGPAVFEEQPSAFEKSEDLAMDFDLGDDVVDAAQDEELDLDLTDLEVDSPEALDIDLDLGDVETEDDGSEVSFDLNLEDDFTAEAESPEAESAEDTSLDFDLGELEDSVELDLKNEESATIEDSPAEEEFSLDWDVDTAESEDAERDLSAELSELDSALEADFESETPAFEEAEETSVDEEPIAELEEPLAELEEPSAEFDEASSAESEEPETDFDLSAEFEEQPLEPESKEETSAFFEEESALLDEDLSLESSASEEPLADLEPSAEFEEPSADFEEPSAEFEEPSEELEEFSTEFEEEPSAEFDKEPSAEFEEEPATDLDDDLQELAEGLDSEESLDLDDEATEAIDADAINAELEAMDLEAESEADLQPAEVDFDLEFPDEGDDETLESESLEAELDLGADDDQLGEAFDLDDDKIEADIDLSALDDEVDALASGMDLAAEDADLAITEEKDDEVADLEEFSLDTDLSDDLELDTEQNLQAEEDTDIPTLAEAPADDDVTLVRADAVDTIPDMPSDLDDTLMREPVSEPEQEVSPVDSAKDDVFSEALSGLPEPEDALAGDDDLTDEDLDAELDFLADTDEAATKLDLARAYIDMGDQEGAKDILDEVVQEGNDQQKQEAEELLSRIG